MPILQKKVIMPNFRHIPTFHHVTWKMFLFKLGQALGLELKVIRKMGAATFTEEKKREAFGDYQAKEYDVFVTVYSKSGTNWLLQATQQIISHSQAEYDHIHDLVAWPEGPFPGIIPLENLSPIDLFPERLRVIKTALPADYVPYNDASKYISVIRDPKEVVVSSYHFFKGTFGVSDKLGIGEFVDLFTSSEYLRGSWAVHTDSFWRMRDRSNVLVLLFGEMKKDPDAALEKIRAFLEVDLSPEVMELVIKRSSFQYMREHESQFATPFIPFVPVSKIPMMMRSGKTGNSGELLTRDMQAQIDAYCINELKELGSDFPYREVFQVVE